MALAQPAALAQFVFVTVAFAALIHAYRHLGLLGRERRRRTRTRPSRCSTRSAAPGGTTRARCVLWVLILTLFGARGRAVRRAICRRALRARVLARAGHDRRRASSPSCCSPRTRSCGSIRRRSTATSFNPLLQDPGLAFHPPMLYLGYVGFSIAFSFAVAALIEGRVDAAWARWVRPWTLAAWSLPDRRHRARLLVGLLRARLGRLVVLGPGRERLLHAVAGRHRAAAFGDRGREARRAEELDHPARDPHLLASRCSAPSWCARACSPRCTPSPPTRRAASSSWCCWRSRSAARWRSTPGARRRCRAAGCSRRSAARAPWCSTTCCWRPRPRPCCSARSIRCSLDTIGGPKISVGAPFFNATFVPLMVPLLIAVPIGSMLAWKRGDLAGVLGRLMAAFAGRGGGRPAVDRLHDLRTGGWRPLGIGARRLGDRGRAESSWAARVRPVRARSGAACAARPRPAALGLGDDARACRPGRADPRHHRLERVADRAHPGDAPGRDRRARRLRRPLRRRRRGARARTTWRSAARFEVTRDGAPVTVPRLGEALLPGRAQPTTEAGIDTSLLRDLYVVLGDPATARRRLGRSVRLYHNPLVLWIWGGGGIMALGGAALAHRPAPARRRAAAREAARAAWPRAPDHGARAVGAAGTVSGVCSSLPAACSCRGRLPGDRPDPRPEHAAVGADRQARARFRAAAARRAATGRASPRRPRRQAGPGQRLRLVVRALPDRAPDPDAAGRAGRRRSTASTTRTGRRTRAWLRELGDPFPQIGADRDGRVGIEWGVYGVPETYVIDRDGRIAYRHVGPLQARDLERTILPLLRS